MEPRALVHRFAELCTRHDPAGFAEVIAPDYRQHNPGVPPGLDGVRQGFAAFLAVFPDLAAAVEAVVAQGDLVAARFTWEGTHRAEFLGVPASGRRVRWGSADWWRVRDGRLAEHWDVIDLAGLGEQLRGGGAGAVAR